MFKKKNKQTTKDNETASQVDQDLIVHNMPQGSSGGSSTSGASSFSSSNRLSQEKSPNNFKMVGALIIGLGVILVGALIFISYRFLIKPEAKPETNLQVQSNTQQNSQDDSNAVEPDELAATSSEEIKVIDGAEVIIGDKELATSTSENGIIDIIDQVEPIPVIEIEDTDADGLNNEEESILGTSINEVDSDADGYLDLAEIENGYNPAGDGNLSDNASLGTYFSPVANYSLLYPKAWELSATNNDYTVIISAPDNSLIQISVQPNTKMQGILTWYFETVVPGDPDYSLVKDGQGWSGLMGEDGRNFYLTDEERVNIYVVSYIPVISSRLAYFNIFNLIINSLQIN